MTDYKARQALIDEMLELGHQALIPIHERLLAAARRGMSDPDQITQEEMRVICYALIVQYHRAGIN